MTKAVRLIIPRNPKGIAFHRTMDAFLHQYATPPDQVVLDFSQLHFILPPSVAFLHNLTRWFLQAEIEVGYAGMDTDRRCIRFLDDSGFFEQNLGHRLHPDSKCRATTAELKSLRHMDSHAWLNFEFIPWLSDKSGLPSGALSEVWTSIQELVNNTNDHTLYDEACFFGQWYPNREEVRFTIADFGCGIPENANKAMGKTSDLDAIEWAVQDGNSSKSLPTNRGAGLFIMLQNFVANFKGQVTITSGRGCIVFENRNGVIQKRRIDGAQKNLPFFCLGTSVDVILNTANISEEAGEEDFVW